MQSNFEYTSISRAVRALESIAESLSVIAKSKETPKMSLPVIDPSKGYILVNYEGLGLYEICKDDSKGIFESDEAAVQAAVRDGIKFIPIEELPEFFERKYIGWVDTPENRKAIYRYTYN